MTIREYKENSSTFITEPFNIRGNKANKEFIQTLVDKKNPEKFANEGLALDYIVQTFKQAKENTSALTEQLTKEISEMKATIEKLEKEKSELQANEKISTECLENLQSEIKSITENTNGSIALTKYPAFIELKNKLEVTLPKLFKDHIEQNIERIPVSNEQMLNLLIDYAQRDPSKEFPFEPIARNIYETYLKEQNGKKEEEEKMD